MIRAGDEDNRNDEQPPVGIAYEIRFFFKAAVLIWLLPGRGSRQNVKPSAECQTFSLRHLWPAQGAAAGR